MPRPYSSAPHSLAQPIQGYYIINLLHEPLRNLEREEKTDFTKEESQPITNWTVQKKPLHRKNTYQSHQIKRFTGKYSNPMHQIHVFTGKYPKQMHQLHVFTGKYPERGHQIPLLPVRGLNLSTHFAIRPISTPHQTTSMPLLTV